jgi:hypothetical protein
MKFAQRLLMAAGAVAIAAILSVALAPRAVHAVVATLVQIVPGSTTHVGQNEGQLVALTCSQGQGYCLRQSPSGGFLSLSPFAVPAGYTLIVTDYNWVYNSSTCPTPGGLCPGDQLENLSATIGGYFAMVEYVVSQSNGGAVGHQHFTSGVAIASGVTVTDSAANSNVGNSTVYGYLVPN